MAYATWNPSDKGTGVVLSNGNLTFTTPGNFTYPSVRATIGKSAGKWYWELSSSGNTGSMNGAGKSTAALTSYPGTDANGWGLYWSNGSKYNNGAATAYASAIANGVVVGVKLDMDAGTISFVVGGVDKGIAFSGLTGTVYPMGGTGVGGSASVVTANFGASAFTYTVPAGYNAGVFDSFTGTASGFSSTNFGTPTAKKSQNAAGFSSTQFGTPLAVYNHIESATGFSSTAFGTPTRVTFAQASGFSSSAFGTPANVPNAVGFRSTQFGTPQLSWRMYVTGFSSTQFGTPAAFQGFRAESLGATSRFGTPSTPFNQTQTATALASTRFGTPIVLGYTPINLDRTEIASSVGRTSRFGTPTAALSVSGQASGFNSTAFGTPVADATQRYVQASSVEPAAAFGTPKALITGHATGLRSTAFGTPTVRLTCVASSLGPTSRFGTPAQWGPHRAYSIKPRGAFGRPTAFNQFRYPAAGFCSSQFGTPASVQTHRASSLPPTSRFGTPLLRRNPTCPFPQTQRATGLSTTQFGTPIAWSP